jgi:hypothetical protein
MALDRWIALILLGLCLAYGYTAWFTMDASLAPFMKRNPIWPSTFPKVLSILGTIACLIILTGIEKTEIKEGRDRLPPPSRIQTWPSGHAAGPDGGVCTVPAPRWFHHLNHCISVSWCVHSGRTQMDTHGICGHHRNNDRLVFGARGAWHLHASTAKFAGRLIC